MGRTIEIPDEMVRGGVDVTRKAGTIDDGRPHYKERTLIAGSIPAPSPLPGWPKEQDKWNWSYAQFLDLERHAGNLKFWWYEPFSLWLVRPNKEAKEQGVRHKVDFMIWGNDGALTMVEVKGHSRNLRDGITRYKIARELFPCFQWKLVKRAGHGWEEY